MNNPFTPRTRSRSAPMEERRRTPAGWATAVVMLLVMVLVTGACGGDSTEEQRGATEDGTAGGAQPASLRIAFVPATTALPLHVAKTQGFFDKSKLNVTLTEAANISDIPPALGRQFDIAMGTATDLIRAGAAGVDVVQISGNTVSTKANPFVQVFTRPGSGITDMGQLAGKSVGSPTLSGVIHAAVLYAVRQKGVDPASVNGVQVPPPNLPDQLKAGRVDAVEALEPFASQLKKNGNPSLGDPFSAIADPLATNFFIAQGAWAKNNEDVVDRFVAALEQARNFIDQNPSEARRTLKDYTGMPDAVANAVPLPTYDFEIRRDDLRKWIDVLKDIGQFDGQVDPEKLMLSAGR